MNQTDPALIDQIKDKLKFSKINALKLQELDHMLNQIQSSKQQYEENKLITRLQTVENKLSEISNLLAELTLLIKKKSGFLQYFKLSPDIQSIQLKCCEEIKILYYDTSKHLEDCPLITISTYTQQKQMIDTDFIKIITLIKINHPKIFPIKYGLNLMLRQGIYSEIYEIEVLRRDLIKKIIEKTFNNLDEHQKQYLLQFDKKKHNYQLFKAEYSISSKICAFTSEFFPYVITAYQNQNIIYLCKDMKLKFFPNHFLTVLETNTKNQDLDNFSTVSDSNDEKNKNILKIANYGYIKFQYSNIDQQQEEIQNNEQKPEQQVLINYEFYLKNSNIFLLDYIPQINAQLFHDNNGFYILPEKTPIQNYYYLFYKKQLQTKAKEFKIGLQLKGTGWIYIETEKNKAERHNA
ncbi:unnamed protein product [Paramecium sonneborni]|uniref:Uncharacterized protein n=1 Tax=Paramecium sonneborni TaxID=65129 RepID=A0A8S1NN17_9CILI|nr:unnamed protein product [Paramecium sonneborni]